jgi:hypothetical protein
MRGILPILCLLILVCGCVQQTTPKEAAFNLTIDEWTSWGAPENAHKIRSFTVEAKEGEGFGPNDFTAAPQKSPFTLIEAKDEGAIVQFDESLVVVGEPIDEPSKQNPKTISIEGTCFRTRSYDSGADLCLSLVR